MPTQILLIQIGALLHFGILIASALVPGALNWRDELQSLNQLSRRLIWVHGGFIVLVIIGFGVTALVGAEQLAGGTLLARCLCAFIGVFWLARLAVQFLIFDVRGYLRTAFLRVGYHSLTGVFAYLGGVFTWTAISPAGAAPM